MAGLIEKDRSCQHCGKSPITGYKYCSACKYPAKLIYMRKRGGHKERKEQLRAQKEAIKQQVEGIGVKVCTQCNKEKAMIEFSLQGNWRSRKATCKECLSVGEIYKVKKPPLKREEGKKECGKCHEMKPLNEYYKRRKGKSDIKSYCSICEGKARNPNYQPIDKGAVEAKRKARAELKEMNSKKRVKQEEERLQRKMLTEPRKEAIRMFNE